MGECSRYIILSRVQMSIIRHQLEALPCGGNCSVAGRLSLFPLFDKGQAEFGNGDRQWTGN
jgi:hypothetical protein